MINLTTLPEEIIALIVANLHRQELSIFSLVNRRCHRIAVAQLYRWVRWEIPVSYQPQHWQTWQERSGTVEKLPVEADSISKIGSLEKFRDTLRDAINLRSLIHVASFDCKRNFEEVLLNILSMLPPVLKHLHLSTNNIQFQFKAVTQLTSLDIDAGDSGFYHRRMGRYGVWNVYSVFSLPLLQRLRLGHFAITSGLTYVPTDTDLAKSSNIRVLSLGCQSPTSEIQRILTWPKALTVLKLRSTKFGHPENFDTSLAGVMEMVHCQSECLERLHVEECPEAEVSFNIEKLHFIQDFKALTILAVPFGLMLDWTGERISSTTYTTARRELFKFLPPNLEHLILQMQNFYWFDPQLYDPNERIEDEWEVWLANAYETFAGTKGITRRALTSHAEDICRFLRGLCLEKPFLYQKLRQVTIWRNRETDDRSAIWAWNWQIEFVELGDEYAKAGMKLDVCTRDAANMSAFFSEW